MCQLAFLLLFVQRRYKEIGEMKSEKEKMTATIPLGPSNIVRQMKVQWMRIVQTATSPS